MEESANRLYVTRPAFELKYRVVSSFLLAGAGYGDTPSGFPRSLYSIRSRLEVWGEETDFVHVVDCFIYLVFFFFAKIMAGMQ